VLAMAVLAAGLGFVLDLRPIDPLQLVLLIVLAVVAELLEVNVYGHSTISVSVAVNYAAALIAGVPGLVLVSAAVVTVHYVKRRPAPYQTAFNWATHVLAALLPFFVVHWNVADLNTANVIVIGTLIVMTSLGYFFIETGLVATAIALSNHASIYATWSTQFRWLLSQYLVLCGLGAFLAIAYVALGPAGLIIFALPPFMMHYVQKEYVERTKDSVRELQRLNTELMRANQEVVTASRAIQELNNELFSILAKIVDVRDPYVTSHTTRVAEYAVAVASELGLPLARVETIRQAALLHDIGKIGIPEEILHKPKRLTDEEYQLVQRHTELGAELLETCQGLRHLVPFVKHHHERWDGTGYPERFQGEAIPLEARILAVCDAVEAMASDRPYSRARSLDQIVAELQQCAGTQFDPAIVAVFVKVARRRGNGFVVNSARDVVLRQAEQQRSDSVTAAEPLKNTAGSPLFASFDNSQSTTPA
jgi:putative nucleotidyltransferase with HDIG domain